MIVAVAALLSRRQIKNNREQNSARPVVIFFALSLVRSCPLHIFVCKVAFAAIMLVAVAFL